MDGITWLASYPKSGNTWLRCLLEAYRCNGRLDINDLGTGTGDSSLCYWRAVCPIPVADLGNAGQWLLRPAALLNALMVNPSRRLFKTHCANLRPPGVPAFIPRELTKRAVYLIRDPRAVLSSFARHYGLSIDVAAEKMSQQDFYIGDLKTQAPQPLSTWSNHVRSWVGETAFPVHVVKYEELIEDTAAQFREIVEFLELGYDEPRAERAVRAASLSALKAQEAERGFCEWKIEHRGRFFNGGGDWRQDLGPRWIKRIERDHGEVMRQMDYL